MIDRLLSLLPPQEAQALAGYPHWLLAVAAVAAVFLVLWIVGKVLKLVLYLALIALAVGLLVYGGWWALKSLHLL